METLIICVIAGAIGGIMAGPLGAIVAFYGTAIIINQKCDDKQYHEYI